MVIHFMIIFLTLACLLLICFIARLQVHFHLCKKSMNTIHLCKTSQLSQKIYIFLCIGLEFRSHNSFFICCYCLSLCFFQAFTSFFTSAFDMALFRTSQFGEPLAQRRKNPVTNSVWLRGKTSETQRTWSRKARRQATETEWNFSVFFYFQNVSKNKRQFTPDSLRLFIPPLHKNCICITIWKLNSESLKTAFFGVKLKIKHMWNPSST